MMNMSVLNSGLANAKNSRKIDIYRTPVEAVKPLLKYINKDFVIWESTDLNGEYDITKTFQENGYDVVFTGCSDFMEKKIDDVIDINFFNVDENTLPKKDKPYAMVTNPPFSVKDAFINKGLELIRKGIIDKAVYLLPSNSLAGKNRYKTVYSKLKEYDIRFTYISFSGRVNYFLDDVQCKSGSWFDSGWFIFEKGYEDNKIFFEEI